MDDDLPLHDESNTNTSVYLDELISHAFDFLLARLNQTLQFVDLVLENVLEFFEFLIFQLEIAHAIELKRSVRDEM